MRRLGIERAFGTGGYGAAPAVAAARALGRPYVLHESNSIPGRANRAFARRARAVTCVFHRTLQEVPGAVRTGQPIRAALREAALLTKETGEHVLVTGGSQGAAFLNGIAPSAARIAGGEWLHATGAAHLESVVASGLPEGYRAAAYLESAEMAAAYRWARVAVGRSGGTLAEYALFRLPSVLVPLPSSADGHQLHNAEEFAAMGAATLLPQASATPEGLAEAVSFWLTSPDARDKAAAALADWDRPNATAEIAELVLK
jgi:UDP-N-acetylglucosamine--N-acetylmuramyl-(pentapeptide) pyrophosphoryl-undecaprenol N-acetylglucosamine transferase